MAGIMVLGLAGCQGGTESGGSSAAKNPGTEQAGSSQASSDAPQDLTIWMGSWWEDQIPAIVEAYKDVKPNVNLTIEALPVNGYVDKAVTTILGGGGPDILAVDVTQMAHTTDFHTAQAAPSCIIIRPCLMRREWPILRRVGPMMICWK